MLRKNCVECDHCGNCMHSWAHFSACLVEPENELNADFSPSASDTPRGYDAVPYWVEEL